MRSARVEERTNRHIGRDGLGCVSVEVFVSVHCTQVKFNLRVVVWDVYLPTQMMTVKHFLSTHEQVFNGIDWEPVRFGKIKVNRLCQSRFQSQESDFQVMCEEYTMMANDELIATKTVKLLFGMWADQKT